jgi:hypothetical protein
MIAARAGDLRFVATEVSESLLSRTGRVAFPQALICTSWLSSRICRMATSERQLVVGPARHITNESRPPSTPFKVPANDNSRISRRHGSFSKLPDISELQLRNFQPPRLIDRSDIPRVIIVLHHMDISPLVHIIRLSDSESD